MSITKISGSKAVCTTVSFKGTHKNKNNSQQHKPSRQIASLDPKALALAAALSTMTVSCSEAPKKDVLPENNIKIETLENLKKQRTDLNAYFYDFLEQGIECEAFDLKLLKSHKDINSYRLEAKYNGMDFSSYFDLHSGNEQANKVHGSFFIGPSGYIKSDYYYFNADSTENKKEIKFSIRKANENEYMEFKIHRNDDGKLFLIDDKNNIIELNKEELKKAAKEIQDPNSSKAKADKKINTLALVMAIMFILHGVSSIALARLK